MPTLQLFYSACIALLLGTLLTSCGGERKNDPVVVTQLTIDTALEQAVDNNMIASAERFAIQAVDFDNTAGEFCLLPDTALLGDLQQGWRTLSEAWFRLLPYNFGPLDDDIVFPTYTFIDSLRLRGTNYSGTVRAEIASNIAGDFPLDEAYFARQSFQKVGLLALEISLFERASDSSRDVSDITDEFRSTPRKCDILRGLSIQLLQRAETIRNGWSLTYKNTDQAYRTLFLQANLDDGTPPLTQLFSAVQRYLDYVKLRNVVTTTASLSEHAWPLVSVSIDEIESLLRGTDDTRISFFDLMRSAGAESSVETVEQNIDAIRQSIASKDAVLFGVAVALLDGNFKREIPNGLDVELGITFTDGD